MPILDRRPPPDFAHVAKYPGTALRRLQKTVATVEVTKIPLPKDYHVFYDQGDEGACVGFGESILMSILNRKKYEARWLYNEARLIDEWPDTPPADGTSLRAGFDILRTKGHARYYAGRSRAAEMDEGIVDVNRWLTSVDQIRTAISEGFAVVLGVNWYNGFYHPVAKATGLRGRAEAWLDEPLAWGSIAGGHCICAPLASDRRQAIGWLNSWGTSYPWPTWVSYSALERLLGEQGEAAIVTDK